MSEITTRARAKRRGYEAGRRWGHLFTGLEYAHGRGADARAVEPHWRLVFAAAFERGARNR